MHTGRWGIDASDPRWGDGHYYNYGGDCLDPRVYPRSKFVSEFGFQAFPSFSVLKQVTAPEDWSYTSAMMNYRCWAVPIAGPGHQLHNASSHAPPESQ